MHRKSFKKSVNENDIELPLLGQEGSQKPSSLPKRHFTDYIKPEFYNTRYIQNMPFLKLLTFFDSFLFLRETNMKPDPLKQEDLHLPLWFCNVEEKIAALDTEWTKQKKKTKPSIVMATFKAYKKECFLVVFLCFMYANINLFCLLLAGSIIETVTEHNYGDPLDLNNTLLSVLILAIASLMGVFAETWFWHIVCLNSMRIRNTIIGFAYTKLQNVALSSLQEINIGKVINLLSNDINDLDEGLTCVAPMMMSPYILAIGGFLIWNFFGYTTIFGFAAIVAVLFLSKYVSDKTESIRIEKNALTDERIRLTNELIEGIRLIKMYAWGKAFKHIIQTLREQEVKKVIQLQILDALGTSLSFVSAQIALIIMCVIYTLDGGVLSPKKIYTSLMILNFVRLWGISFFHFGAMFVANSRVMKTRVEEVLSIDDVQSIDATLKKLSSTRIKDKPSSKSSLLQNQQKEDSQLKGAVIFQDFSAWWTKDSASPCLDNITLTLYPAQITTVIGTIGSGKTCFLLSFLREIPLTRGDLLFNGRVAYVEQEPIIFPGTIRSNILFGLEYEDELYKKIVRACGLREDFRQFDSGDKTIVGERGITLSGGQKARVSLARALYSRSDIYLFDDPLSAVDSRVGRHIFNNAIKSDLLKDKVVVLVTHHLTYAKEADRVLLFEGGKVIGDGNFESLKSLDNNLLAIFSEVEEDKIANPRNQSSMRVSEHEKKESVFEDQEAETGEGDIQVTWSTYKNYIKQTNNYRFLFAIILLYFAAAILSIYFSRIVGYWGEVQDAYYYDLAQDQERRAEIEPFDNSYFIILSLSLIALLVVLELMKSISIFKFMVQLNSNMHENMLKRLIRATVLFFDTTPIGTILNRFSNDVGVLDGTNTQVVSEVAHGTIYISWMLITLVAISIFLLIPCLIIFFILYKLRRFFAKPVMETKRLDLASRSPLYSEISTTVSGLLAIRVYQQGANFIRKFCNLLFVNTRAFFYMERTVQYFSFTLSLLLNSLSITSIFLLVFVVKYTNLDASLFGLVIVILQETVGLGSWIVRLTLVLDVNIQSVERILGYYNLPQEPSDQLPNVNLECSVYSGSAWPSIGQIEFNNIYMKYRPELDYVLQGLTFNIPGGCKVGIVGRTGAGKSSIIQALFRMVDFERFPGSFIKVDGADTTKIGLELLRKSIAIIPQNPVIFTGNVRRNLDPFDELTDEKLWEALKEVNLKNYVSSLENKLDTDMTLSNSIFSAGQKQLVCLARAILRKAKILVLDEATANVDIETDDFIQKKIMERFRDCTVITIAHRLITISNYDKVLVMDKGRVVEFDSPYMLLVKKEGDKEITRDDSIFADMVKKSGESMSRKIFEVAAGKFHRNSEFF